MIVYVLLKKSTEFQLFSTGVGRQAMSTSHDEKMDKNHTIIRYTICIKIMFKDIKIAAIIIRHRSNTPPTLRAIAGVIVWLFIFGIIGKRRSTS